MTEEVKGRRRYDATRRQAQAQESRRRILAAARRLFAARGYAATTVEQIAAEAGVAVPTVYAAFGNKRALLTHLLGVLISGNDGATPVLETPEARTVLAEPDQRRMLRLFARHMRAIQERVGPILAVVRGAAQADAEVAALSQHLQARRLGNMRELTRRVAERGPLREGLGVEEAAETLWALTSGDLHHLVTVERGWSGDRYERWLGDTLIAALLP